MGKRKAKSGGGGGLNLKFVLRHEHLKNLALWSSGGDTPLPSLASLFGRRLAADPELVSCQRCETVLELGFNCNVRIEKVSAKKKKKKKRQSKCCLTQNNVVYHCSSHRNLKRGTSKGHMKEIYPSKPKTPMMMMMPEEAESNTEVEGIVVNTPKPILTLEREKRIRKSKTVGGSDRTGAREIRGRV